MVDEFESEETARPAEADGDMAAVALGLAGASRNQADDYLAKQSRLTDLRIEFVEQQDRLELAHLRFRHWSDWAKFTLQVAGGLLVLALLVAIGAAVWNASQADGVVVEAFSVPPDFAARGIGGDVVAQDVTNKLFAIREEVDGNAYSSAADVSRDRASDMKVEIPETGVSLGEAWRALKSWLGNERHLGGNLRQQPDGTLLLSATLDTGAAFTVQGKDLDVLEQKVAEEILCAADAIGCVNYLVGQDRWDELKQRLAGWQATQRSPESLAMEYSILGGVRAIARNDLEGGLALEKLALSYAPKRARTLNLLAMTAEALGRSEEAVAVEREVLTLSERDQPRRLQGSGFALMRGEAQAEIARLTGDFDALAHYNCGSRCSPDFEFAIHAFAGAMQHDFAAADANLTSAGESGGGNAVHFWLATTVRDMQRGDWPAALAAASEGIRLAQAERSLWLRFARREYELELILSKAVAQAHLNDMAAARATLASTNADCYPCLIARGDVEALARNWSAAETWYARAAAQGPSLPFAYLNWGATLLQKGDRDGAIAKFALAHEKGPHFADPLEYWGEALMAQNRSDLALAKFSEAARYAPNWGRLHLKWGEALLWSGDKAGAQKQFAAAAKLDLTTAERAQLARVHHG